MTTKYYECRGTGSHASYRFPAGESCPLCSRPEPQPAPEWVFTAEDFARVFRPGEIMTASSFANVANAKLAEWTAALNQMKFRYSENVAGHPTIVPDEAGTYVMTILHIRPIETPDTAEGLLRSFIKSVEPHLENNSLEDNVRDLYDRARKLLEGK